MPSSGMNSNSPQHPNNEHEPRQHTSNPMNQRDAFASSDDETGHIAPQVDLNQNDPTPQTTNTAITTAEEQDQHQQHRGGHKNDASGPSPKLAAVFHNDANNSPTVHFAIDDNGEEEASEVGTHAPTTVARGNSSSSTRNFHQPTSNTAVVSASGGDVVGGGGGSAADGMRMRRTTAAAASPDNGGSVVPTPTESRTSINIDGGGEEGNGSASDADSVESDYYYDDRGKIQTYYRPKRRFGRSGAAVSGSQSQNGSLPGRDSSAVGGGAGGGVFGVSIDTVDSRGGDQLIASEQQQHQEDEQPHTRSGSVASTANTADTSGTNANRRPGVVGAIVSASTNLFTSFASTFGTPSPAGGGAGANRKQHSTLSRRRSPAGGGGGGGGGAPVYPFDNGSIYIAPPPPSARAFNAPSSQSRNDGYLTNAADASGRYELQPIASTRNNVSFNNNNSLISASQHRRNNNMTVASSSNTNNNNNNNGNAPFGAGNDQNVRRDTADVGVGNESLYRAPADDDGAGRDAVAAPSPTVTVNLDNKSIAALPENLHGLGAKIHKLSTEELLHISGMVSRKAHREVYSVLQYSGEAWYLPEIRRTRPGEKRWELMYYWGVGLIITLGGRRMRLRMISYSIRVLIMALIWFLVWCSTIPKGWSYRGTPGYFLDPYATILVSAIVGGLVCRLLQIPPLVGVLWMGIVWNNIGPEVGYFTSGILPQVRTITSRSGLAIIVIRCGFSINLKSVTPIVGNVLASAAALGVETIAHAMVAMYYLNYGDWKWAFCQAMINAVPSAAIVVPGVLLLQADGYSRSSGPLPLMLATLGVEASVGIWAANFLFGLISSDKSIGYLAGMGPVQIVGGLVAGFLAALVIHLIVWILRNEADRLPDGKYSDGHLRKVQRMATVMVLLGGHAMLFYSYEIDMAGGGVVAAMFMAFCIAHMWSRNNDEEWLDMKRSLGLRLAEVWDLAAMPYLFSIAGSKIVLSKVFNKTYFPKALVCFVVAEGARMVYTLFTSLGLGFTWKERLFHVLASTSKATLQIAMASSPLDYINKRIKALPAGDPQLVELTNQLDMAEQFQTTCVLFVLISAPFAAIVVTRLGPIALKRE